MENKYKDKRGNIYQLVSKNTRHVYLRNSKSHPESIGEKFTILNFSKNFTRLVSP